MHVRRCLRAKKSIGIGLLLIIFVVISICYLNQEQADILDHPQALGLLVNTSGYALPEYNPWDPTLKKILVPGIQVDCTGGKKPLTSTTYLHQTSTSQNANKGSQIHVPQGHLVYHRDHEREYSWSGLSCCYQAITRGPSQSLNNYTEDTDSRYKLGSCIPVKNDVTPIYESFIYIRCKNSYYIIVYRNVHHFIQRDHLNSILGKNIAMMELLNSKSSTSSKNSDNQKPLSVMLMGLDSTSRNNLQRYLPKTFAYLKESKAIDLLGYNKVGDNTFPNLLPLLSGLQEKTILQKCTNGVRKGPFDKCSFLWNNFSTLGYVTAYGEDSIEDGTFNYMKTGYVSPPTDLYLRPFIQASEDLIGYYTNKLQPVPAWCLGHRTSTEIVYDYALEMLENIHEVPSFSLFWSSRYTHDNLELPNAIDESTRTFLQKASKRDDLILIFLSDHGLRFGDIRKTIIGKYEENMPYFFVLLPQWFIKKYKTAYRALQENQNRLVTPQDIYVTLLDILQEQYKNKKYLSTTHNLKSTAMTLFKEIPKERNCDDALVPYNFCSGILYDDIYPYSPQTIKAANYIISFLNKGLSKYDDCVQLKLLRIIRARQGLVKRIPVYSITIMTYPANALLETTVKEINGEFEVSGEVSRINRYGLQSVCISNGLYKKYCFCKYFRYIPFVWNKSI